MFVRICDRTIRSSALVVRSFGHDQNNRVAAYFEFIMLCSTRIVLWRLEFLLLCPFKFILRSRVLGRLYSSTILLFVVHTDAVFRNRFCDFNIKRIEQTDFDTYIALSSILYSSNRIPPTAIGHRTGGFLYVVTYENHHMCSSDDVRSRGSGVPVPLFPKKNLISCRATRRNVILPDLKQGHTQICSPYSVCVSLLLLPSVS